jgi:integrase
MADRHPAQPFGGEAVVIGRELRAAEVRAKLGGAGAYAPKGHDAGEVQPFVLTINLGDRTQICFPFRSCSATANRRESTANILGGSIYTASKSNASKTASRVSPVAATSMIRPAERLLKVDAVRQRGLSPCSMLQFAVTRRLISTNPGKGVQLLKGAQKERFLTEGEVARLADALANMERERKLSGTAATAVRLLMLTGCRKSEILSLRWEWVDIERGCLRLPDSKTGAKNVPLAIAAMELLNGVSREPDAVFVLPAATGQGHYVGLQKDWEHIRAQADLNGLRLHDLRHSFASFAVAGGHSLFLVGKVLGHKQARTTEGYAHLAADPVLAVADTTAARIVEAMKGNAEPTAD